MEEFGNICGTNFCDLGPKSQKFVPQKLMPQHFMPAKINALKVGESRYQVWVCLSSISCAVLTGECGCAAVFSEACKHVFALLHHIEHHVTLGHNKTCTSKEQIWNKTTDKKGEKIHRPAVLSEITFDRAHPEYEADYVRRKRSTFDPRPLTTKSRYLPYRLE